MPLSLLSHMSMAAHVQHLARSLFHNCGAGPGLALLYPGFCCECNALGSQELLSSMVPLW